MRIRPRGRREAVRAAVARGADVSYGYVVPTVAGAVDVVVHVAKNGAGHRRVLEIVALSGRTERDVVEVSSVFASAGPGPGPGAGVAAARGAVRLGRLRPGRPARAWARAGGGVTWACSLVFCSVWACSWSWRVGVPRRGRHRAGAVPRRCSRQAGVAGVSARQLHAISGAAGVVVAFAWMSRFRTRTRAGSPASCRPPLRSPGKTRWSLTSTADSGEPRVVARPGRRRKSCGRQQRAGGTPRRRRENAVGTAGQRPKMRGRQP